MDNSDTNICKECKFRKRHFTDWLVGDGGAAKCKHISAKIMDYVTGEQKMKSCWSMRRISVAKCPIFIAR